MPQSTKGIEPVALAWLVGLFEGEGCIGRADGGRPSLVVSMTDEDVIRRAHTIAGVGHVRERPHLTAGGKRMWTWLVGRCDEAAWLLEQMLPMFGVRRATKAREALATYRAAKPPKRLRTHCVRGHPFSGDNLYSYLRNGRPVRACRACNLANQKAYLARKRGEA